MSSLSVAAYHIEQRHKRNLPIHFLTYYRYGNKYGFYLGTAKAILFASMIFLMYGTLAQLHLLPCKNLMGAQIFCAVGGVGVGSAAWGFWKLRKCRVEQAPGLVNPPYHFWNVGDTAKRLGDEHDALGMQFGEEYGSAQVYAYFLFLIGLPLFCAGLAAPSVKDYVLTATFLPLGAGLLVLHTIAMFTLNAIKKQVNQTKQMSLNERFYTDYLRKIFTCACCRS